MNNNTLLLKSFLEEGFFIKRFLFLPILTLFIFADIYLSISLSGFLGTYLYLSLLLLYSLGGILIIIRRQQSILSTIMKNQKKGIFNEAIYQIFITGIISGIFIFIPGIITTTLGFFFLFPYLSKQIGKHISTLMKINWHEIYEYQNIIKY